MKSGAKRVVFVHNAVFETSKNFCVKKNFSKRACSGGN